MKKKVLIADDQPSLRLLVSATLASDELDIMEAADGDEAWEMIESQRPDLALLDIQMPGRSGLELAHAIRGSRDLTHTRIILLTSKAQQSDVRAGLEAGVDHYLTKPFSPLELLDEVERVLALP
jgi:CheY-like chemotaxis protein